MSYYPTPQLTEEEKAERAARYEAQRAAEQAAEDKKAREFQATMRDVAESLELVWKPWADIDHPNRRTKSGTLIGRTGGNGEEIHVTFDGWQNKDRISFTASYPKDTLRYNESRPAITVAATKTAAQIVKDVQRRLLPEYLKTLPEKLELKRQREEHEAARIETLKRLRVAFKDTRGTTDDGRRDTSIYFSQGRAEVYGPDSVTFERLTTTPEQAEQIAKILGL